MQIKLFYIKLYINLNIYLIITDMNIEHSHDDDIPLAIYVHLVANSSYAVIRMLVCYDWSFL